MRYRFVGKLGLGLALPHLVVLCFAIATAVASPLLAKGNAPPGSERRVKVGVLVDTSLHQKKVIEFQRQAVDSIAEELGGVAADTFLFTYSDRLTLLQDWSPVTVGLKTASPLIRLDGQENKHPATLLVDAINAALLKLGAQPEDGLKALIVIGEGNDARSSVKYSQVKKLARSNHVQCFALLIADHNLMGGRVRHFGWDLYDLASATKGAGYDIEHSRKRLEKALKNVLERIRQNQARQGPRE